jgi:uncharacterized membrane protein (DUF373 family)
MALARKPFSCTLKLEVAACRLSPSPNAMAEHNQSRPNLFLGYVETAIYVILGVLLSAAAVLGILGSFHLFANGIRDLNGTSAIFDFIDRLLLVLMLVELLHTVRISIRSHTLVIEPFLIVGLIAIIRRTLVLTLQSEGFTQNIHWTPDVQSRFHASVIEGGMLALLMTVLVGSIYVIRKTRSTEEVDIAPETSSLFQRRRKR